MFAHLWRRDEILDTNKLMFIHFQKMIALDKQSDFDDNMVTRTKDFFIKFIESQQILMKIEMRMRSKSSFLNASQRFQWHK